MGQEYSAVYVYEDGLVVLGNKTVGSYPRRLPIAKMHATTLLAVFWTDVDSVQDQITYNLIEKDNLPFYSEVTEVITRTHLLDFEPLWALVVNWKDVSPYPASLYAKLQNATFQCILITDGDRTFAQYKYFDETTEWSSPAYMGYDFGEMNNSFYNYPGKANLLPNVTETNTGEKGIWLFQLYASTTECTQHRECKKWVKGNRIASVQDLVCPCTWNQTLADSRYKANNTELCAHLVNSTSDGFGVKCCYQSDNKLGAFGSLLVSASGPSQIYAFGKYDSDEKARIACCKNIYDCETFYHYRPSPSCQQYKPPSTVPNALAPLQVVSILNVIVGQEVTFTIKASSKNTTIRCDLPPGGLCITSEDGGSVQVKWTPKSLDPVDMRFVGTDSDGNQTSLHLVTINVCDCNSHGTCDFKRLRPGEQAESRFRVVSCECSSGFTGPSCEYDFDGCVASPCSSFGEKCIDLSPSTQNQSRDAFQCSNCPTGFTSNNFKCVDILECVLNKSLCQSPHVCRNTIGSYYCECKNGYEPDGSTACIPKKVRDSVNLSIDLPDDFSDKNSAVSSALKDIFSSLSTVKGITGLTLVYNSTTNKTKVHFTVNLNKPAEPSDDNAVASLIRNYVRDNRPITINGQNVTMVPDTPFMIVPLPNGTEIYIPLGINNTDSNLCDLVYKPSNACKNGGECSIRQDGNPECNCKNGFTGKYCEYETTTTTNTNEDVIFLIAGIVTMAVMTTCCCFAAIARRTSKGEDEYVQAVEESSSTVPSTALAVPSTTFMPRYRPGWRHFSDFPDTVSESTGPSVHRSPPFLYPPTPWDIETISVQSVSEVTSVSSDSTVSEDPWYLDCPNEEFQIPRPIREERRNPLFKYT
ncbi:hypothetical protein CHS0354_035647 [Potamilus streckersoni]|uniref:Uncharacterized protein n=1 Tax=Potamilus streckersoni TaxID=2493646 RepID=A0AAE0SAM3_9BIVA|nr:hypothetical protein CHS0354_035647 [Potamilus streckersoni]